VPLRHAVVNEPKTARCSGPLIIDGFTRHLCIEDLGWPMIKATIYAGMTDREAKALSYEANVTRRNLSNLEKANAMQDAANDGFDRKEIAKLFGVPRRTVDRYLELPEELRCHIDCKTITMAHARTLKPLLGVVSSELIGDLLAWIRETGASERALKAKLKKEGLIDQRGNRKTFGVIANGAVRGYAFKIGSQSSARDREDAIRFLERAIERIRTLALGDSGTSEFPG
jgi:ParB-like chromosome segregation protein Spo0J